MPENRKRFHANSSPDAKIVELVNEIVLIRACQ